MAAAVGDYRPAAPEETKRRKSAEPWSVDLEPTTDVLSELGERRRAGQTLVGFAADEGAAGLGRAKEKLAGKKADLFVFNDVSRADIGFDSDENEVVIVGGKRDVSVRKAPKAEVAAAIFDEIERLRADR
jgi:phosphopantothenoylcysteine decarboxylase/phosphopantothenate--cysteine ligase